MVILLSRTQGIATPLRSVADIRRPVSLRSAASLQGLFLLCSTFCLGRKGLRPSNLEGGNPLPPLGYLFQID